MRVPWGGLLLLLVTATACDSFSVLDQFEVPSKGPRLTLAIQTPTLQQNESTLLVPSGGKPPYTYAVLEDDLPYKGTLGSTTADPAQYTAGTSIGRLKVRVIDSSGATADATVTVLPPPPTSFTVTYSASPPKNALAWTYTTTAFISGFQLETSSDSGVTYTAVAVTLGKTDGSYEHQGGAVQGNYYRLYAVNGSFRSLPVEAN